MQINRRYFGTRWLATLDVVYFFRLKNINANLLIVIAAVYGYFNIC